SLGFMASFEIDGDEIFDWPSFHSTFSRVMKFPDFYGRTMDAWIDCMSDLHGTNALCGHHLPEGESIVLRILGIRALNQRCPGLIQELAECTSAVNRRYISMGTKACVSLVML